MPEMLTSQAATLDRRCTRRERKAGISVTCLAGSQYVAAGGLTLATDVTAVVADPSFRGTCPHDVHLHSQEVPRPVGGQEPAMPECTAVPGRQPWTGLIASPS